MLDKIDARGMSCPEPVLMTKRALEENKNGASVLVDNNTACGNVERFMKNAGYNVSIENVGEDFLLTAKK